MKIAVAGATGTVGRHVAGVAAERGHEVVTVARSQGIDVTTGAGLDTALHGVDVVIDVTNLVTLSTRRARAFFEASTRTLLAAGSAAGVTHHVALSIVGIDGIDASYYAGKLAQERALAGGDVPYTIARTAQCHEFAGQLLSIQRGPLAVLPRALIRPVSAREVGEHLVSIAEAGPVGRARDLVGPRDERLADLARRQLAADGIRRRVLEVRLPGAYGAGLASGVLRGDASARQATVTFDEWLSSPHREATRQASAS